MGGGDTIRSCGMDGRVDCESRGVEISQRARVGEDAAVVVDVEQRGGGD